MSENLVSPSRALTIAGKSYMLDGAFETLRAVQQRFDKDIVQVLVGVMDMPFHDFVDLIATGCKQDARAIGQDILDATGVMTHEYTNLKMQVLAWLNVAIAPKVDREKKKAEMDALIQKQNSTSPGPTTSDSPSAPSDGSPASSGAATSGS